MAAKKHWTQEENELFYKLLREHKKDYQIIANTLGTKTKEQVRLHAYDLRKRISSYRNNHPQADLLPILETPKIKEKRVWTPEKHVSFVNAV